MKADIINLEGQKVKTINLPIQFEEEYRPNLIKRAILVLFSNKRQKYGAQIGAGMRQSAVISKRRRSYKTSYGHGISRSPRKALWSRGTQFGWVGAVAPNTVGGRAAHPPKSEKKWELKINNTERRKAIRSAISATAKDLIILEDKFESLNKTKDVKSTFEKIDIAETKERKIRKGKGKLRGRKYKKSLGPLIIVSKDCDLLKSAANLEGVHIVKVKELNASLLTKGHETPRKTIWSEEAINLLGKEKLFMRKKKNA